MNYCTARELGVALDWNGKGRGRACGGQAYLGWRPKVKFGELVAEMVQKNLAAAERLTLVRRDGHAAFDYRDR